MFHDGGVDWGGTGTACCYTQRRILCGLEAVDMGFCRARCSGGFANERMGLMFIS